MSKKKPTFVYPPENHAEFKYMRHLGLKIFFLVILCTVMSCNRTQTVIQGFAQGGMYKIVLIGDKPLDLKAQLDSLFTIIDNSVSLYNPESLLSRINRNETDSLDEFLIRCITMAEVVSRQSDGSYDITIKPVTAAYGFAGSDTVNIPNIDSLMQFVGYEKITIREGRLQKADPRMQLDLNSIAQGATTDYIAHWFDLQGVMEYLIEVGSGEMFCRGKNLKKNSWHIGIEHPDEKNIFPSGNYEARIRLPDGKGLATSGNYRKFYVTESGQKVVHTFDARTGKSVISNLLSVTVMAPNSAIADAYCTYFMIIGAENTADFLNLHPELDAYLVFSDPVGNIHRYLTPDMEKLVIR